MIDLAQLETTFSTLYAEASRSVLPIRQLVALLLLKQLHNLVDEYAVEQWTLNPCDVTRLFRTG